MIGIKKISSYLAETKRSNFDLMEKFSINESFIEKKLGIKNIRIKNKEDDTSDLCVKAYKNLKNKINIDDSKIDCLIVVTQNPDFNIPHTSAIVHKKLGLSTRCAAFDISLGCSGYVYGVSVIKSFMEENNLSHGILITADPYTKIIDENDKNTTLLFGDGAAATYFSSDPIYKLGKFMFGTLGEKYESLLCKNNILFMDGFEIFNFASKYVPEDLNAVLDLNNITKDEIDLFVFHQGSKYIVDTLRKKLNLPEEKVVFDIEDYGNTVSSSIPMILEKYQEYDKIRNIYFSGFGVGLSWASGVIHRMN